MHPDPVPAYLRWAAARAACWRGYWSVTAVYLVVVADLDPRQLVLVGTGQALTVLATEIPAGVLADTVSRRRAVVVAHVATGAGMVLAGLVTSFPVLVLSQALCGLGWALASGADVAWLSDEVGRATVADRAIAAQARRELVAGPAGMVVAASLAYATSLSVAIVVSGAAFASLGLAVARWPETGFVPADAGRRWHDARVVLRTGARLARADRVIGAALVATMLLHGGFEGYGRLLQRHLLALGMPVEPHAIVWFTTVGLTGYLLGALTLVVVRRHLAGGDAPRRLYAAVCAAGVAGTALVAHAPSVSWAIAGALLVSGVVDPVTRVATTVWVNHRATAATRATVHSFVSQAEHLGEAVLGLSLAVVAGATSVPVAVTASAVLIGGAALVASRAVGRSSPVVLPGGAASSVR